jgi:hypothetical protein
MVAAIASVAVHGALWVGLPILPSEAARDEELDIPEPVSMVELTPADLSRLPDFSEPRLPDLPPVSDLPDAALPNTNSLEYEDGDWYSLNDLDDDLSSYDWYTTPSVPGNPYDYSYRNNNTYGTQSTRPSQSTQSTEPTAPPPPPNDDTAATPPETTDEPSTETSPVSEYTGDMADLPDLNPSDPTSAAPEEDSEDNGQVAAAPATPASSNDDLTREQLLTYSAVGTTQDYFLAESSRQFIAAWIPELAARGAEENLPLNRDWIELSVEAPPTACLIAPEQLEQVDGALTTTYGVIVDASGELLEGVMSVDDETVIGNPETVWRSGFPLLDRAGREVVLNYEFEATGEAEMYFVRTTFDYDADRCQELATPDGEGAIADETGDEASNETGEPTTDDTTAPAADESNPTQDIEEADETSTDDASPSGSAQDLMPTGEDTDNAE